VFPQPCTFGKRSRKEYANSLGPGKTCSEGRFRQDSAKANWPFSTHEFGTNGKEDPPSGGGRTAGTARATAQQYFVNKRTPRPNASGWSPRAQPVADTLWGMGLWCAVTRRAPGVGGVFAPVLLVVAGFAFWLNHG